MKETRMTAAGCAEPRLIGGRFGLETRPLPQLGARPGFLGPQHLFCVNASSALALLLGRLRPGRVFLPAYLCPSLAHAAEHAGCAVQFYPVGENLRPGDPGWQAAIRPGDAVVMIDYFGMGLDLPAINAVRQRGGMVIEDATQAMLSDGAGTRGDFALMSPRKFLGVVDGGILITNLPRSFAPPLLPPPPAGWWLGRLGACEARRDYDRGHGDRGWFAQFQQAEAQAPMGHFRMSDLSHAQLGHCFDYPAIRAQRRENYRQLAASLGDLALWPELPQGAVPLAFPVRVKNRDALRAHLFEQNIYPPVHWDLRGTVADEFIASHALAGEMMSLPCDQRYGASDMQRMINVLQSFLAGPAQ